MKFIQGGTYMSSLNTTEPFKTTVSEKQFNGYWIPNHNAKLIKESIENNSAPFLPDKDGEVKANPIYNGNTGFCLNSKDLIPLQILKENKSNVVVTFKTVSAAGSRIKTDEKGFFYNYRRDDKTVGTSQFFFPEQTEDPDLVKKTVEPKVQKNGVRSAGGTIEIKSADPSEYLSDYVAACKTGAALKVENNVAEEFKKNILPLLDNQILKHADRNQDMDNLGMFMLKVDQKANEKCKEIYAEQAKKHEEHRSKISEKNTEQER